MPLKQAQAQAVCLFQPLLTCLPLPLASAYVTIFKSLCVFSTGLSVNMNYLIVELVKEWAIIPCFQVEKLRLQTDLLSVTQLVSIDCHLESVLWALNTDLPPSLSSFPLFSGSFFYPDPRKAVWSRAFPSHRRAQYQLCCQLFQ